MGDFIERLRSLQRKLSGDNIGLLINDAIRQIEPDVIALVQDQMYEHGVMDIRKPNLRLQYSTQYKKSKRLKAKFNRVDFITLRYTGQLYDLMKIVYFKDKILITTTDLKWANWLENNPRFENAIGLTDANKQVLGQMIKDILVANFKKA